MWEISLTGERGESVAPPPEFLPIVGETLRLMTTGGIPLESLFGVLAFASLCWEDLSTNLKEKSDVMKVLVHEHPEILAVGLIHLACVWLVDDEIPAGFWHAAMVMASPKHRAVSMRGFRTLV